MKKLLAAAALTACATLSMTGCGSSTNAADQHAKDSLKQQLASDAKSNASDPMNDTSTASCVANNLFDKVGLKNLTTYGLFDAQGNAAKDGLGAMKASPSDATAVADTLFSCVGADKVADEIRTEITSGASAETVACIKQAVTNDDIHSLLVGVIQGQQSAAAQSAQQAIAAKATACKPKS